MDRRNFEYMFYGFTVAWLIVFVYVLTLVRRGNRLRAELQRHAEPIDGSGPPP
ncbi:MAG: CcmD family protein [Bryobacteraceae bacterium]